MLSSLPPEIYIRILEFIPRDRDMRSPPATEIHKIIKSMNESRAILLFPYKSFHDTHTFQFKHIFYRYALRYNHYMKTKNKLFPQIN